MISKIFKKSAKPDGIIATQLVSRPKSMARSAKSATARLPNFMPMRKKSHAPQIVDQYVFALSQASCSTGRAAYRMADIQICVEIDLGLTLSLGDIEAIIHQHANAAHKADWYFTNLNHAEAAMLIDAVHDAHAQCPTPSRDQKGFIEALESAFDATFTAAAS